MNNPDRLTTNTENIEQNTETVQSAIETINDVEHFIEEKLNLEGAEKTTAVDDALLYAVQNSHENSLVEKAVETVVIEGALEESGDKQTSGENPIIDLEKAGYDESVSKTINKFRDDKLPNGRNISSLAVNIIDRYEKHQRQLIESQKNILRSDWAWESVVQEKQRKTTPSITGMAIRNMIDTKTIKRVFPKIHAKIENKREGEAMFVAADEYANELISEIAAKELVKKEAIERENAMFAKMQAERELGQKSSDEFRKKMHEEKLRAIDLAESQLNESLCDITSLESAINNGDTDISKHEITSKDDKVLTVYDLNGHDFRYLTTNIRYKEKYKGANISKHLCEHPEFWVRHQGSIKHEKYSGEYGDTPIEEQGGTSLSVSYFDTNKNLSAAVYNSDMESRAIRYGFSNIRNGGLVDLARGDMVSDHRIENHTMPIISTEINNYPEWLAGNAGRGPSEYNEILLRRYDQNGIPKPPDFMVTYNNQISDYVKKHAEYFNIPIVNINASHYDSYRQKHLD